jgi:hypothetical protein
MCGQMSQAAGWRWATRCVLAAPCPPADCSRTTTVLAADSGPAEVGQALGGLAVAQSAVPYARLDPPRQLGFF